MQVVEQIEEHSFGVSLILSYKPESGIGQRIARSLDNKFGWKKNVVSKQLNFDKPIVLCFGGAGIDDDKSANGIAKIVQGMLGRNNIYDNDVQLFSVVYPKDLERLGDERAKFLRGEIKKKIDYIGRIYETIFIPMLRFIIENGDDKSSLDIVRKQFRNITIFSHCHGSFVACELINYLKEGFEILCKKNTISKENADSLIGEITNIMLSPRDGVQYSYGALNLGFTMATDNLEGGIKEPQRKGFNVGISNFADKLLTGKIKGCESFGFKDGAFFNFWDTDRFGADIKFIDDMDDSFCGNVSEMIYSNIFMGNHFHLFENYCSLNGGFDEDGVGAILKNEKGKNFTYMIARALQNAVSLSLAGKKRTIENVVSNATPIIYNKGDKESNLDFFDVKFDGSLETLFANYNKMIGGSKTSLTLSEISQNQR